MRVDAARAPVLGLAIGLVPLFPAFVTLTGASVPGVSLLPHAAVPALFAIACAISAYVGFVLLAAPGVTIPALRPLAVLPAAAALAAVLGLNPRASAAPVLILAFGVLWYAAVVRSAADLRVVRTTRWCFVGSGCAAALVALAAQLTRTPAALYTIGHGRAIGTFIVPGELAGYLIVYIPFAYAVAVAERGALRAAAVAGLIAGLAAFAASFSRAGCAGLAAAVAVYVFLAHGRRAAHYALGAVVVAALGLALAFNAHHDPSENFTRLSIWRAALALIERFPLTGIGPFEFASAYPLVRPPDGEPQAFHAHSILLTVAAETGLIGLAALVAGWWAFVRSFAARLRATPARPAIAIALAAGLAGTWVQGLVDTVSVVIFALWYPCMGLALAALPPAADAAPARAPARRRYAAAAAAVAAALLALAAWVQLGSAALLGAAAAPLSVPARLPARVGQRIYGVIERPAPLPFVETMLAQDALRRNDVVDAARHAGRLPLGAERDELFARLADARRDAAEAQRRYLAAGDDAAVQDRVERLAAAGRLTDAYGLEDALRRALLAAGTRPNALADAWWRLGRLALRQGRPAAAGDDYARAAALAPFNTKYLIDGGVLALERHRAADAVDDFERALTIDPGSADALAGLGLAALGRGDRLAAATLAARAARLDRRTALVQRLLVRLQPGSPGG